MANICKTVVWGKDFEIAFNGTTFRLNADYQNLFGSTRYSVMVYKDLELRKVWELVDEIDNVLDKIYKWDYSEKSQNIDKIGFNMEIYKGFMNSDPDGTVDFIIGELKRFIENDNK